MGHQNIFKRKYYRKYYKENFLVIFFQFWTQKIFFVQLDHIRCCFRGFLQIEFTDFFEISIPRFFARPLARHHSPTPKYLAEIPAVGVSAGSQVCPNSLSHLYLVRAGRPGSPPRFPPQVRREKLNIWEPAGAPLSPKLFIIIFRSKSQKKSAFTRRRTKGLKIKYFDDRIIKKKQAKYKLVFKRSLIIWSYKYKVTLGECPLANILHFFFLELSYSTITYMFDHAY